MRFVADIRAEVEEWEKKLSTISYVLDECIAFQRTWMYLENIFSAEDIQKQLPVDTKQFMLVDKFWKEYMGRVKKLPLVMEHCNNETYLQRFRGYNAQLEVISNHLNDYLETKRAAFPRFYFLSNDDLLEILSQTRNP
jgi:dynein heavy chain